MPLLFEPNRFKYNHSSFVDLLLQVKIHKQTGVGAFYLKTQFKNMDFANKGDGQFFKNTTIIMIIIMIITLKGIGGQIRDNWSAEDKTTSVATIRIADFINNVVATRR